MLTPKGEHLISLFYQGDVRWENHFRRHRNRQKLGDWMIISAGHSSQEKNRTKNTASKPQQLLKLRPNNISTAAVAGVRSRRFEAAILGLNQR
jgi:hypothetical protein